MPRWGRPTERQASTQTPSSNTNGRLALCPAFLDIRTELGNTRREMGDLAGAIRELEHVRAENARFVAGPRPPGSRLLRCRAPRGSGGGVAGSPCRGPGASGGPHVPVSRRAAEQAFRTHRLASGTTRARLLPLRRSLRRRRDPRLRTRRRGRAHVSMDREAGPHDPASDQPARRHSGRPRSRHRLRRHEGQTGHHSAMGERAARGARTGARGGDARAPGAGRFATRQQAPRWTSAGQSFRAGAHGPGSGGGSRGRYRSTGEPSGSGCAASPSSGSPIVSANRGSGPPATTRPRVWRFSEENAKSGIIGAGGCSCRRRSRLCSTACSNGAPPRAAFVSSERATCCRRWRPEDSSFRRRPRSISLAWTPAKSSRPARCQAAARSSHPRHRGACARR